MYWLCSDWPVNAALDGALAVLLPVKDAFGDALSWADLIALAGTVALEGAIGNGPISFCGGRTDALMADGGSDELEPRVIGLANESFVRRSEMLILISKQWPANHFAPAIQSWQSDVRALLGWSVDR